MLKKGLIFMIAAIVLGCSEGHAQEKGGVEVFKDSLITKLQQFRATMGINPIESKPVVVPTKPAVRSAATRVKVRGFRVQIFAGPDRNQAFSEQTRFRNMYKDVDTYITYDEPNYRVKVGDFRSRNEANALMRELRQYFRNVFVFSENVFVYQ